ncbi:hypothetical protein GCM10009804_03130 [Kribbella hippodromi]|uniref:Uncharacterized protein n=1 Tax=Kribbella hippodromi TaxID=434347 RepID=A0ABN2C1W8_9ACTN
MAVPTLAEVRTRLKLTTDRINDDELGDVLAAEIELQRKVCTIPADPTNPPADAFPVPLRTALFRRVARSLALKGIPLAVLQGDAETGTTILPSNDPEVRRIERPYRIEVVA